MSEMAQEIMAVLAELVRGQHPRPPAYRPTAHRSIWIGDRWGEAKVILKRSRAEREGLFYEQLPRRFPLPCPTFIKATADLSGHGCWLLLEAVDCTPPGLSTRSATHWWQQPERRHRAVTMLAALHAQFWNRPEWPAAMPWLPTYGADQFWSVLEQLDPPPSGWQSCSTALLGQLASAAEMLVTGPQTIVHGSFHPDNVGWRDDDPVLVDWEQVSWTSPYVDLGRLFTRLDPAAEEPTPLCPPAWREPLLESYRAALLAQLDESFDLPGLRLDVRNGMLWELAIDCWFQTREPGSGDRAAYHQLLRFAESVADEP